MPAIRPFAAIVITLACVRPAPADESASGTSIDPLAIWIPEGQPSSLPVHVPVHRYRVSSTMGRGYLKALAWGAGNDLWLAFDSGLARIEDAVKSTTWTWYPLPKPEGAIKDTEPEVLAPRGPNGRIAVGTALGRVAVSEGSDPRGLTLRPIQDSPDSAGIMPWVGWAASGAVTAFVHLSCQLVALDPESGADVWRRVDRAARYPAGSSDGRWLLLPWAEGDSDAEVLDADTGKTLACLPRKGDNRVYGAIDDVGRFVVQGRHASRLSIWEWKTGAVRSVDMAKDEGPISMAFVPRTSRCVVLSKTAISMLDVADRRWVTRWEAKETGPLGEYVPQSDLSVSADGARVAVLNERREVIVLAIPK